MLKILVISILILIIGSLFSALLFMFKDQGNGTRMVKALTIRISLSLALFGLLMAGYYFGIIPPQGL